MAYTTIDNPGLYFNTVLYTGNASDDRSISGVGFQPDLLWLKRRNGVGSQRLVDVIRGATKTLVANGDGGENTEADVIQAFESDGFQIGADSASNADAGTMASWNWKAGGSASSNTDGDITSSVSANTTSGFSILSYTGNATAEDSIGHGLGVAPEMIIIKKYSESDDWMVYHKNLTAGSEIKLNSTAAQADDVNNATWGDNHPTNVGSSTFEVGAAGDSNADGASHIAYCFHGVKGYSKFGTYIGNNSTEGTFCFTGFRPAWVMIKALNASQGWPCYDNKRDTFNPLENTFYNSTNEAEADFVGFDFCANGFKHRSAGGSHNYTGYTYIYIAFAEAPFVNSNGVPGNAR